MDTDSLIRFTTEGMMLCLYVSLPPVLVAAFVGLGVSFVQAITSLQDQSFPQVMKLITVTITIVVVGPLGCAAVLNFANQMMRTAVPL